MVTDSFTNLVTILKQNSLEALRAESNFEQLILQENNDLKKLNFRDRIACIFLVGSGLQINFKLYYWLDDVVFLLQRFHRDLSRSSLEYKARDFAKEVTNITVGRLKSLLKEGGLNLGQSLPVTIDGFNQIFSLKNLPNKLQTSWDILGPEIDFCCLCEVFCPNERVEKIIKNLDPQTIANNIDLF